MEVVLKYSILIYGSETVAARLSPETHAELLKGHKALQAELERRGGFGSVRLMPTTSAVTLRRRAGEPAAIVTDGPHADTKEQFLGFYVAEFASLDEAIELSQLIASDSTVVEIRPAGWVGGNLLGA